ncbi:hypothetical protein [Iamia sp.]|uniref:hypothetical protein n=1 Tax=Iamia sp. TaxID=2722710 RepID=UPI002C599DE3|nr:hypothetical protein [Iamia sp.]HXH57729.1 hypothetical protein [Iamia sp.]
MLTRLDLVAYLREPVPDEEYALDLIVAVANGLVQEHTGPLDPEPFAVQAVRFEIAARAWRNPGGYTSETVDSYTWRRDDGRSGVYLTTAERDDLLAAVTPNLNPGPWSGSLPYSRSW